MPQLGVIGLGTMGANIARNAARNGATVAVFNRTTQKMEAFMEEHGKEGNFIPCKTLADLLKALPSPRAILIMVQAGEAVDQILEELLSLKAQSSKLKAHDILIDGGNSHYRDTERRIKYLQSSNEQRATSNIRYIGMGVSGGEQGALLGPSLMPGGSKEAYDHLEPLLQKMAADDGSTMLTTGGDRGKCVTYIGAGGSGHFVKMVHNGIEYGIMQLIAETYHFLKTIGKKSNADCAKIFAEWNTDAALSSYLLEITARICRKKDPESGNDLLDVIKDATGQKGTGQWVVEAALRYGVAIPTIAAALDARIISAQRELRAQRSGDFPLPRAEKKEGEEEELTGSLRSALLLATICTYAQGFDLLERASMEERWNLHFREIARIWRGGCIIRSALLKTFQNIFAGGEESRQRLHAFFSGGAQERWRTIVAAGTRYGIPLPAFGASMSYFDALRTARLPANLTAAQRDFFGAHGYERTDKPGIFHTEWK